jgi:hypothetical protein
VLVRGGGDVRGGMGSGRGDCEPAGYDDEFGILGHGDWVGRFPVSCCLVFDGVFFQEPGEDISGCSFGVPVL